jgi:hypothetical protein
MAQYSQPHFEWEQSQKWQTLFAAPFPGKEQNPVPQQLCEDTLGANRFYAYHLILKALKSVAIILKG